MGAGGRRAAAFKRANDSDPYFSFVKLLLKFDNNFIDGKGHVTTNYSTTFSTDRVYGTHSALFSSSGLDVSGGGDLSIAANQDFVIEFFSKLTSQQLDRFIFGFRAEGASTGTIIGTSAGGGTLRFAFGGEKTGTTRIDDNAWRYNRIIRQADRVSMYTGLVSSGVSAREYTGTGLNLVTQTVAANRPRLGANDFQATPTSNYLVGMMDSARITIGSARGYSAADTSVPIPPEFPAT